MGQSSFTRRTAVVIAVASSLTLTSGLTVTSSAYARDFFSAFFGGFSEPARAPSGALPFAAEFGETPSPVKRAASYGGGSAYCVRTCDGRYFPLAAANGKSRAEVCKSFCPASETKVVYGSNIDNAATDSGKPYSELPNAFKYRTELVSGCTCNGKDPAGLAKVNVENDPTIRKGDLVAGANGIVVANSNGDRRGASVNYSPISKSARANFDRLPVVAAQ